MSLLAPFRFVLLGVFLLQLAAHGTALVQPLVASRVVEGVQEGGSLVGPVMVLGSLAAVGMVLNYAGVYVHGRVGESFVLRIRSQLARRIFGARVSKVESSSTGDVLSRVGADTTLLRQTVISSTVELLIVPFTLVIAVVLMIVIDPALAVTVVVMLAVTTVVETWAFRRVSEQTERAQGYLGAMTGVMQRALLAFRTVKASRTEKHEADAFDKEAHGSYRAGVSAARTEAVADTAALGSVEITFLLVLGVGAIRVSAGEMNIGDLVALLLYVVYIQEPVGSLVTSASELSEGLAAARRVDELLQLEPEAPPAARAAHRTSAPDAEPGVRLERVTFGYANRTVLKDVTIDAPKGLTVLVGPSGTGKTTALSLIERFVEPDGGRILLNGADIHEMDLSELRGRVSYVQQEAPLLGATIREAASYGAPDVDPDRIAVVLKSVGLMDWVTTLPDGLDTEVGERGLHISGGQRQRLAVARALLRPSEVLLLDEATSQLDPHSERVLLASLAEHACDKVVIAVTHRLPIALQADQVVMLEDGRVHAAGPHETLLATDAKYQALVAAAS
ncbi:ABC transporter ATP-binding protein [Streptomyces sp. NPDC020412]|uniref:ABC transporter ATP-binding protein n=1 Tax=Streptomyces sp. NPDC020412 TaxID=3365073 RepID=UPI003787A701